MTDELKGYIGLNKHYEHLTAKHSAGEYVCALSGALPLMTLKVSGL